MKPGKTSIRKLASRWRLPSPPKLKVNTTPALEQGEATEFVNILPGLVKVALPCYADGVASGIRVFTTSAVGLFCERMHAGLFRSAGYLSPLVPIRLVAGQTAESLE